MNPPIKPQIPWDIPALRRYLSLIEVHDLVGLYHKDPALFDLLLTESGESAVDALGLGLSDDPHEKAQALPVGLRRAGIAV